MVMYDHTKHQMPSVMMARKIWERGERRAPTGPRGLGVLGGWGIGRSLRSPVEARAVRPRVP